MNIPEDLKYTKSHEWLRISDNEVTVGITDFAQAQLGDLTFVELPAVDDQAEAEGELVVVESVKAASDVYSPVSGSVTAINDSLEMTPELINTDPYGEGWMFKVAASSLDESAFLSAAEYAALAPSEG